MIFSIMIQNDLESKLAVLAKKMGQTRTDLIKKAIAHYVKSKERKMTKENHDTHWSLEELEAALKN